MIKLCKSLFSRYFLSAVLILAELALLFYLIFFVYGFSAYTLVMIAAFNLFAVIGLINRDANPEYKVSWLVILMLFPPFGTALYLLFYPRGIAKGGACEMEKIHDHLEKIDTDQGQGRENELDLVKSKSCLAAGRALAILNGDSLSSVYFHTSSSFFSDGRVMFENMLLDIERAERYIFLEYFIISSGRMWDEIYSRLIEKVKNGVEVRVIYDDIGCMRTLPLHFDKRLNDVGIKCLRFSPVTPRLSTAHNNRDHRKILIIDGKYAYTGGINIADEYINERERFGYWKDCGIRLSGDAVRGFVKLFLSAWCFASGKWGGQGKYFEIKTPKIVGDGGAYIPFGSGPSPIYKRPVCKNAFLDMTNQAERYLYVTTPYLVIDHEVTEALRNAAQRGVDVKIITPLRADKRLIKIMTKGSYSHLMEAGVQIYEYTPGFIHGKSVVSDDLYALVGTVNLDYRSLAHHFENAVWICGSPTVFEIRDEFLKTLGVSEKKEKSSARLGPFEWCIRSLMRLFAPLL